MNRPPSSPTSLISVIVTALNQPAATRRCLSALLRQTDGPWELIVVTRGDDAVTAAYIEGIRDAVAFRVVHLVVSGCTSLRAAWARGLRQARGESLVLIRNTVVVTDAWLRQLTALAGLAPGIGLVGPMSNAASGAQAAGPVPYDPMDLEAVAVFAARWRADRRGQWQTVDALQGGCVLLRRAVIETSSGGRLVNAGGLRPRRLAVRARRLGYESAVALDLFVHDDARRRRPEGMISPVTTGIPAVRRPTTGRNRARRVSLTMIVRNEEANLADCLTSAAGLFDEVVIVDTGSTDRTVAIARSFGAKLFEFPWIDDFAAARNAALAHATGDFAFWLDADDRVEPADRSRLQALFDGLGATECAYVVRCSCDPDPTAGGATVVDHIRLFPLRDDVRWTYRVHEQILPALRKAGVEVRWSDATVRHVGYNDPVLRGRKLDRDRAILEREVTDRPGDPFVLFNLGQIALERNDPRAALAHLRRSLSGSAPTDSITRKLFALIALCHQRLGETGEALSVCAAGLQVVPQDAELLFRQGVLHRMRGERSEAEVCWRQVLSLGRPERFSSLDVGIFGHVTRRNLARLAEERGDVGEATRHWQAILSECPGDSEATAALAEPRVLALAGGPA